MSEIEILVISYSRI